MYVCMYVCVCLSVSVSIFVLANKTWKQMIHYILVSVTMTNRFMKSSPIGQLLYKCNCLEGLESALIDREYKQTRKK